MDNNFAATAAYQIPTDNLSELQAKVVRLARKAKALGMAPLTLTTVHVAPRVTYRSRPGDVYGLLGLMRYELPCTWVELSGPSPVVAGHSFLARLEHTEAGNLVASADVGIGPTVDLSPWYTAKANCDHCGHNRKRNDTFLLRTPEGTLKQIGRNCLADYLRSGDAEVATGILELIDVLRRASGEVDEDFDGDGGGALWVHAIETAAFLACAVSSVRRSGFRKKGSDGGSTAGDAEFLVGPCPSGSAVAGGERARRDWIEGQPTEEDRAKAIVVRAWVAATTEQGDYMHNLRVACKPETVGTRSSGVLASAVAAYDRAMGTAATRAKLSRGESAFQGAVGKRETWTLTVGKIVSWDSAYGTTHLHLMTDDAGNVFAWKSSSGRLEEGRVYSVKGTVKKHEEYKGTKQTILSRCVATEVKEVVAA